MGGWQWTVVFAFVCAGSVSGCGEGSDSPQLCRSRDGTRLKVSWLVPADGTWIRSPLDLAFDTTLGMRCEPRMIGNAMRCAPPELGFLRFADDACSEPIAWMPLVTQPPPYATVGDHVYEVLDPVPEGAAIYEAYAVGGTCARRGSASSHYILGDIVDAKLVRLVETVEGDGRIAWHMLAADDGFAACDGLYDTELEGACSYLEPAGALHCVASAATERAVFLDAACTQRVKALHPENGNASFILSWTASGELRVHERGAPIDDVYLRGPGGCEPAGAPAYDFGEEVAAYPFAVADTAMLGGARLKVQAYVVDGRAATKTWWDTRFDAPCRPSEDPDSVLRCLPDPSLYYREYTYRDPFCSESLPVLTGEANGTFAETGDGTRYWRAGDEYTEPIYYRNGGRCQQLDTTTAFLIAEELGPTDFVPLERASND